MERPAVAIGHVRLHCQDVRRSSSFYQSLGLRDCGSQWDHLAILELRGGTHLLLIKSPDEMMEVLDQPFDLMVDDVVAFGRGLAEKGIEVSGISSHEIAGHLRIWVTDPDGRRIPIHSSHTEGRPV